MRAAQQKIRELERLVGKQAVELEVLRAARDEGPLQRRRGLSFSGRHNNFRCIAAAMLLLLGRWRDTPFRRQRDDKEVKNDSEAKFPAPRNQPRTAAPADEAGNSQSATPGAGDEPRTAAATGASAVYAADVTAQSPGARAPGDCWFPGPMPYATGGLVRDPARSNGRARVPEWEPRNRAPGRRRRDEGVRGAVPRRCVLSLWCDEERSRLARSHGATSL